jgi:hypothetical protein
MANPTTNYGFVLPTSTDLVTDLPADFDVALQGVDTRLKALQPGTTLGDVAYSSATANTNTRLGIGSSGQVLTVSGGVPAWTTPSNAMTLISSTSFTSQASQAFDGVFSSTYKSYIVYLQTVFGSVANNSIRMQLRIAGPTTITAGYHNGFISGQPNGTSFIVGNNNGSFAQVSADYGTTAALGVSGQFNFLGCSGSSAVPTVTYQTSNGYSVLSVNGGFVIGGADTYTGFILSGSAGNISGTVHIFGVK